MIDSGYFSAEMWSRIARESRHASGLRQMDLSADLCYNFLLNDVLGDVFYDTE